MCLLLAYYGYLHIHMESNMIFEVIWVNLGCVSEYSFNCKSCGAARVCIDIVVLYETFHLFLQSFIIHYYMNRTYDVQFVSVYNKFEHTSTCAVLDALVFITNLSTQSTCAVLFCLGIHLYLLMHMIGLL